MPHCIKRKRMRKDKWRPRTIGRPLARWTDDIKSHGESLGASGARPCELEIIAGPCKQEIVWVSVHNMFVSSLSRKPIFVSEIRNGDGVTIKLVVNLLLSCCICELNSEQSGSFVAQITSQSLYHTRKVWILDTEDRWYLLKKLVFIAKYDYVLY